MLPVRLLLRALSGKRKNIVVCAQEVFRDPSVDFQRRLISSQQSVAIGRIVFVERHERIGKAAHRLLLYGHNVSLQLIKGGGLLRLLERKSVERLADRAARADTGGRQSRLQSRRSNPLD